jgi:ankyrin repeat protein
VVNLKDKGGRTALSYAAEEGHEAVVKLLLNRTDVKAHLKDKEGRTALTYAVESGHEVITRLLNTNEQLR